MAFLKNALAGLPTRPALYLAVPVLALGIGYHLYSTHASCRTHAELREALGTAIAVSAGGGTPVRLAQIANFPWDRAEVLVNYKPEGTTTDCPFGWDWTREHRERLIAADRLTVIVFLEDGKLKDYLEYSRDRADFVGISNPYTRQTAVFRASPSPDDPYRFILSPLP